MGSENVQWKQVTHPRHGVGIRVGQATLMKIHRAMLIIALVGLFASMYLFITYVSGKPIACGILKGCEIVRASKWAYTFGLPRPMLGVVYYLGIVFLLAYRAYAPHVRPFWWRIALLSIATVGLFESGFLTIIQWLDIRAFCTWCVTSAVAATIVFVLSLFDGREPTAKGAIFKELKFIFIVFSAVIVLGAIALHFLLVSEAGGVGR